MTSDDEKAEQIEELVSTPHLADALESEQFRRFLDQVPIAIAVSELKANEHIIYANPEFEKLSGLRAAELEGEPWRVLNGQGKGEHSERRLGEAVVDATDRVGTFRLVALVDVTAHGQAQREELEQRLREKDTLLNEIQHRVKNNLQMITALIRLESRNARGETTMSFDRLAGRIESLSLLYHALSASEEGQVVDLGVYLSQIASAVMRSHAVEGIRLDLKVDAYPVSVNVAMPTGLVVNEILINALKHAFVGREGGTITLHSLVDGNGCRVVVGDDGIGLPAGAEWPRRGKLGSLIVTSLRENAKARLEVESSPGKGTRVTIVFTRAAAAPSSQPGN